MVTTAVNLKSSSALQLLHVPAAHIIVSITLILTWSNALLAMIPMWEIVGGADKGGSVVRLKLSQEDSTFHKIQYFQSFGPRGFRW